MIIQTSIKKFYLHHEIKIFAVLSFLIPLIVYLITLERKLVGGDTTWYAIYIPEMRVMVPTGYPAFSMISKLFAIIPFGDLAYRLNLVSAVFGSLTVPLLFLAINRLIKNTIISLSAALTFAFLFTFWTIANRFEFDSLNSFFIALILYSILLYSDKPNKKNFYFAAAALGLSLTNHPIAFFTIPSFFLYMVLVNPKMFKNIKAILTGTLFFLMPLALYAWLPIRSLQGYGPVTTLRSFIYYLMGRDVSGKVHGGSFIEKNIDTFLTVIKDFSLTIYKNFGIILLVIAAIGLIYLIRKNWKFSLCSFLMIFFNIGIISLYLPYSPPNYTINTMMVISIYIASGFLLIFNFFNLKLKKFGQVLLNKHKTGKIKYFHFFITSILLIAFMSSPVLLAVKNYEEADFSKPLEVYEFWNDVFDYIENGSVLYVASKSSNIGQFINSYERTEKNITFIINKDERYTPENVKKDLAESRKIYFIGIEDKLENVFNVKKINAYAWDRMKEYIVFYKCEGEKSDLKIKYELKKEDFIFGEKFEIEYHIINDNDVDLVVTSIELDLSDNVDFIGVNQKGSVALDPAMAQGKLMWVKNFNVPSNSRINIILILQATSPGKAGIDFKITSQAHYFEADEVELYISD